MSKRLTTGEIERIRERYSVEFAGQSLVFLTEREVSSLLHLHDIIQRLQTLQASQVTPEELEAVSNETPGVVMSWTIAAVCRGMLREMGNE